MKKYHPNYNKSGVVALTVGSIPPFSLGEHGINVPHPVDPVYVAWFFAIITL
jgi:hypothetical protein